MVMLDKPSQQLQQLINSVANDYDCQCVGVEKASEPGQRILRIYVEQADASNPVSINQLARLHKACLPLLAVEAVWTADWSISFSSPGIERPLFNVQDAVKFAGHKARLYVQTDTGKQCWDVVLCGVQDDALRIQIDGEEKLLPWGQLWRGHLLKDEPS